MINMAHDRDHRRPRDAFSSCAFLTSSSFGNFLGCLLFKTNYAGFRPKEPRHFASELSIESLVDSRKHAFGKQTRNQVLRADAKLLGQVLYADPLGNRDVARDRQGLVRKRKPWRRHKALHGAFFYSTRNIALARPPGWTSRSAAWTRWSRRRKPWS